MSVIIPFTLTPEQQMHLLAMAAAQDEGESEERLQSLREREEDVDTLKRCSEILTSRGFASGNDLSIHELSYLLALVRALAPNPNLDARLLASPGEPGAFNGMLRNLLYGPEALTIRLHRFLTRRHFGRQTALQLLCAVFPEDWPLVTQKGIRQLDLTPAQHRAAIQTAQISFDLSMTAGTSGAVTDEGSTVAPNETYVSGDHNLVARLLGEVIIYRAVRNLVEAPDYVAVHRLLTSDVAQGYKPRAGRPDERGTTRQAKGSQPADTTCVRTATRIYEPEPSDYEVAPPKQQTPTDKTPDSPDIRRILTDQLMIQLEAEVENHGFSYPPLALRNYFICLQSKPYVWLLGANGIGKTRLTSLFSELLTGDPADQYRLIPVRPDWADSSPVLGYVNLLAHGGEGRTISTPFLDFVLRAAQPANASRAFFLCLDEMNLARVEHYFAEVLSAMETPGRELLLPNGRSLQLPTNLFLTGTLNTDEATFPLTRKVLDRANTISLQTVLLKPSEAHSSPPSNSPALPFAIRQAIFLQRRVTNAAAANARLHEISSGDGDLADWVVERLIEVNALLEPHDLPIAYRVRDETLCYCANSFDTNGSGLLAPASPGNPIENLRVAFDFQLMQKVLPRLSGTEDRLASVLREFVHWAEAARFARTTGRLQRMLGRLQRDGFIILE